MSPTHERVLDRFVAICREDGRIAAAFLGGSYAGGVPDAYSDLDLFIVTTDAAYDDFFVGREQFIRCLGEPIFLEDYAGSDGRFVYFFLDEGTEGELAIAREGDFARIHIGPHRVLVDKSGVLEGKVFQVDHTESAAQQEVLRRLIYWFWHDLTHHFITPMARGQLWSAYGGLEDLRETCINLVRLESNFWGETEGFEKIESAAPLPELAPLRVTFCPLEAGAMIQAVDVIIDFNRTRATRLARVHGITYPAQLEAVVLKRLETMRASLGPH